MFLIYRLTQCEGSESCIPQNAREPAKRGEFYITLAKELFTNQLNAGDHFQCNKEKFAYVQKNFNVNEEPNLTVPNIGGEQSEFWV